MYFKLKITNTLLFELQVVVIAALMDKSIHRTWRGKNKSNTETSLQKPLRSNHIGQKFLQGSWQRRQVCVMVLRKHPSRKSM